MLFIFDENLSETLTKGLSILEGGNLRSPHKAQVRYAPDIMGGTGASDEDIIPKVGELNGILVTQDRDFINKKHYFTLYREHNIGIVLYTIANKDVYWDKVKSFVKNWEDIKEKVSAATPPFVFVIGKNGGISPFKF
jgi:hypothetical protein